jgi:hypothetical protein
MRFDAFEHAASHGAMAEAGDAEVMIREGYVELVEEDIRHVGVEVLAGVDDDFLDAVVGTDGPAVTVAALMNCGRAPRMLRIFMRKWR